MWSLHEDDLLRKKLHKFQVLHIPHLDVEVEGRSLGHSFLGNLNLVLCWGSSWRSYFGSSPWLGTVELVVWVSNNWSVSNVNPVGWLEGSQFGEESGVSSYGDWRELWGCYECFKGVPHLACLHLTGDQPGKKMEKGSVIWHLSTVRLSKMTYNDQVNCWGGGRWGLSILSVNLKGDCGPFV